MTKPKRTLNELMQTIKANIKRYRAEQASLSLPNPTRRHHHIPTIIMEPGTLEVKEYTTRTADQEICAVEICPAHPEYMIIGTYSLVKNEDRRDYEAQTRRGTLQVTPVAATFQAKYAGMLPPHLDRVDFPCAVLDLHFHPADSTLAGVATSNAQIRFFRFIKHGDVLGRRVITKLLPLGTATVSDPDEHGLIPLVTQFTWFPETRTHGVSGIDDVQEVIFAATTSFGDTKIVKTALPALRDLFDERSTQPSSPELDVEVTVVDVHKHDLEAWTVAVVTLGSKSTSLSAPSTRLILSGGDDSALIASMVDATSTSTPEDLANGILPLWKDQRTHNAGVVSILPLPQIQGQGAHTGGGIIPVVTGSYDEFIRIYELDATTYPYRAKLQTDLRLNGGVWRLKLLDQYSSVNSNRQCNRQSNSTSTATTSITNTTAPNQRHQQQQHHHTLILASLMHGGAAILRLTYTVTTSQSSSSSPPPSPDSWTITPLATFRAGHESMVYCCDAWREDPDPSSKPHSYTYTVVSTSFYDMKICTWTFVDRFKAELDSY